MAGKHGYDEDDLPKAMKKEGKTSRNKDSEIRNEF